MAEYTPNLALKKPSNSDYVRISDNNENMDVLDADIKALQDAIEELESVEVINDLNHTDADKALSANQGKVLDDKISTLTGRIANGEKTAAYEAKRLDNLIKLTQGKVFDYQTDATEAYTKSIPSGSQEYGALNMVGGKSLVYNQLVEYVNTDSTVYGITRTRVSGRVLHYSGTSTNTTNFTVFSNEKVRFISGHKYYCTLGNSNLPIGCRIHFSNVDKAFDAIHAGDDDACTFGVRIDSGTAVDFDTEPSTFDLTQMFGAGNEPTLEQCREIFSADYYPYNAGELMSFAVNEVESVGRNLLKLDTAHISKPTEYSGAWHASIKNGELVIPSSNNYGEGGFGGVWIDCEPNTTYMFSGYAESDSNTNSYICTRYTVENGVVNLVGVVTLLYANKGNFHTSITTNENTERIIFRPTGRYGSSSVRGKDFVFSNLMIEKVATAEAIPTAYCPYRKETFTIPQSILDLPMYGASAGSVYNYIDFDRKVYVQNVGSVDLGTLNYVKSTGAQTDYFRFTLSDAKRANSSYNPSNLLCHIYQTVGSTYVSYSAYPKSIGKGIDSDYAYIQNLDYTDATTFKAAMNGVMLYYELKTPIETDISDLIDNGLIFAEGGGTITFKNVKGDDYHIPVPNKETYMVKLADSI